KRGSDEANMPWLYLGGLAAPLLALVVFDPRGGLGGAEDWPHTLRQVLSLLYLGLVPSALGFYLWNRGAARVSAATLAVMNNLKVPAGVLLAWLLFGEAMVLWRVALGLLLMGGALWLARRSASAQ